MVAKSDAQLAQAAIEWVKGHQKELVHKLAGRYGSASRIPLSIFMAGSPGAGKTEFSKNFIQQFENHEKYIVRIDPDEIREMLPQHTPGKAHLFQTAVGIGVEKVHDHALRTKKSFLLDGTFARFDKAHDNVRRSVGCILTPQYGRQSGSR